MSSEHPSITPPVAAFCICCMPVVYNCGRWAYFPTFAVQVPAHLPLQPALHLEQ